MVRGRKLGRKTGDYMKSYFDVSVTKYDTTKVFHVYRPASLSKPKDNSVMFITEKYMGQVERLRECTNCLVYWPESVSVPEDLRIRHCIVECGNPRKGYCLFYRENRIVYYPPKEKFKVVDGAFIAETAIIGERCTIMPGAYIGGEVVMGNDCYVGTGAKLVGEIHIGNNVIIRENTVIGADGLSTNRDETGKAITMPQFGGVVIEDDVQIGALTVIGRGAIDNTILRRGSKVDNSSFISHNVILGENTFVVGETIMFGSSSTGERAFISGNATIRDGRHVGADAKVGMGAVVVKNVEDGAIVKGNPAK